MTDRGLIPIIWLAILAAVGFTLVSATIENKRDHESRTEQINR